MVYKITTAEARQDFADIVNKVAYGKALHIFTRDGKAMAAMVSMDTLKVLCDIEEKMDIEDSWQARSEPGENVTWEELRKELGI